jgi:hypothetical protein
MERVLASCDALFSMDEGDFISGQEEIDPATE